MLERKEYFISIDNKMVEETKLPGQAELKINATDDEVEIIKNYMINKEINLEETEEEVKELSKDNPSASYTPEVGDSEGYDSDFEKLIDLIYKLGTDATKKELEQYR